MRAEQFRDLIRHAADVCSCRDLIVFGSQSVHAITQSPPAEVIMSVECDIWLRDSPEQASRLEQALGQNSDFAKNSGVYVDALPPDLPLIPSGWETRLVPYQINDITAHCLEVHDLIVSKLAAGRLKDYEFIAATLIAVSQRVR